MPPWLIPTRRVAHGYGAFVTATETLDQRYVVEALPALLAARPLKRALGEYRPMIEVERVSQGHVRKTAQEVARVRWLEAHERELRTALWGTPQTAS
jgi:hypothetical protein